MTATTLTDQTNSAPRHTGWMVVGAVLAVLATTGLYAVNASEPLLFGNLLGAWILLAFNGIAAWQLYRRAIGHESTRFMLFGFFGGGMRVVALGAFGMMIASELGSQSTPFIAALLIGYFVSLKFEIWILHRYALRLEHS